MPKKGIKNNIFGIFYLIELLRQFIIFGYLGVAGHNPFPMNLAKAKQASSSLSHEPKDNPAKVKRMKMDVG